MSIEFFLELLAVVCILAFLAWAYCRIFDFVDEWKKKAVYRRKKAETWAALDEARLPPMTPMTDVDLRQEIFDEVTLALKLPRVVIKGPPSGHERRPARSKAGRMLD